MANPVKAMRPVICMVTDRRRLGSHWEDRLVERVAAAARAGVHLIQIREADLDGGPLTQIVARSVHAVKGTCARVLVNDRLDVALAAGAHGVHLPASSIPAARVRRAVPRGFLIGRSIHSGEEAMAAAREGAVDYLLFGTVFATPSKPGVAAAGTAPLTRISGLVPVPVLAIGGLSAARVVQVAASGAAGVAAIGMFSDCEIGAFPVTVQEVVRAFDTTSAVS